jgi:tRNA 2-thiouridine synthesizing protein A
LTEEPDRTVDCIGLVCPQPLLRTRVALGKMEAGDILEVLADDPDAKKDITGLIRRLDHTLLDLSEDDFILRFLIRKND